MTRSPGVRLLASHALAATAMAMVWPALLADVWAQTRSDAWLGLAAASRLLPYVLLSAAAGLLGDRLVRTRLLRWSTTARAVLLIGCATAVSVDHLGLALAAAIATVAVGTPAYPAAVVAMPVLAGRRSDRLTSLLVTAEVTAFVLGPALGGLLLGMANPAWSVWAAAGLGVAAIPLLSGLHSGPVPAPGAPAEWGRLRTVLASPSVPQAIAVVALVNFVESAVSVGLLSLSHERWQAGDRGYGFATAALGFGSLGAPLIALALRLRGSLLTTAGGVAGAGLAPGVAIAVAPLALAGAAGTVVECASTEILQHAVPDRVRAFALGLTDSVMVVAAFAGALFAPWLASITGAPVLFVALALTLVLAATAVSRQARRAGFSPRVSAIAPEESTRVGATRHHAEVPGNER